MNFLGAAASRMLWLGPKALPQCRTTDSFIVKIVFSPVRPYSISSSPFRRKRTGPFNIFQTQQGFSVNKGSTFGVFQLTRGYAASRIVLRYEDVPRNYKDEEGLPFRVKPFTQSEAATVFGPGIDITRVNQVMKILHGRRVSGTLADPSLGFPLPGCGHRIQSLALSWLRKNVPVNEEDAAGKRAEIELQAMEENWLADSERLGLYKSNAAEGVPKMKTKGEHMSVYGESGLDYIREVYKQRAKLKEEEREKAQKRQVDEMRQNTGTLSTTTAKSRVELGKAREMHPKLKYYLERSKVLPEVPPEMSAWQRLWPSGLVTLAVIVTSVAVASVYIPPQKAARLWPDIPPAAATILPLILMNTIIFVAWRVPPAFRILNKYFMSVPGYPRAFAVLGNTFSHQLVGHFFGNMVMLWFLGTRLHDDIGRANFLAIYLSSGVLASFSSLCIFAYRKRFITSSIGASGALAGITTTFLWLHFNDHFKLLGIPPDPIPGIPGWAFLILFIAYDIIQLRTMAKPGGLIDHYAHLGGSATGIIAAEILKGRAMERRRLEIERKSVRERFSASLGK